MKSFHDFNIFKYEVNCDKKSLTLYLTEHHGSKSGVVEFEHVMGHHFVHVLEGNIVLDFEEYSASEFFQSFEKEVQTYQKYGLPIKTDGAEIFAAEALNKNLKFIVISSSYGLSGWVICKAVVVS